MKKIRAIAAREAEEIEHRYPKLLRRVGGYNLDMLGAGAFNQSRWRSIHPPLQGEGRGGDGVHQAEGVGSTWRTCSWAPRARSRIRGACISICRPCPSTRRSACATSRAFYQSMEAPQHIVKLGPVAVELVDRTMIGLSRANAGVPRHRRAVHQGRPGRDTAGRIRRRRARRAAEEAEAAHRADGRSRFAGQRRGDHRRRSCSATCGRCARRGSTS